MNKLSLLQHRPYAHNFLTYYSPNAQHYTTPRYIDLRDSCYKLPTQVSFQHESVDRMRSR